MEALKWGLKSSTIVHFCGPSGPLFQGNFRRKMTTIVGNRGQLWTSTLRPHLLSPHLDFPEVRDNGEFGVFSLGEQGEFTETP